MTGLNTKPARQVPGARMAQHSAWLWLRRVPLALALALTSPCHAGDMQSGSAGMDDFIVMEARSGAYGFIFDDLVVLDPRDGRILRVLPMTSQLLDDPKLRPDDRLQLLPIDRTAIRTVVAPGGQTVVHSRTMGADQASRRVHSYVWRVDTGELIFTRANAYSFALLGEDGDHVAILTEDNSSAVTEFQVWNTSDGRLVFKARFPESESVRAHRTRSRHFAAFTLDNDYVMLWNHRLGKLHRIAIPEGRQLDQVRHGHKWDLLLGTIEISANDRWLAFIAQGTRQTPSPNYYLVNIEESGSLEPIKLAASGMSLGNSFRWLSFGAGLLGWSETSLHRLALPFDRGGGRWTPKAWVAQGPSAADCTGTSTESIRRCSKARDREIARRAFLPPGAMLEPVEVNVHTRYVTSNDATLLVGWDSYNGRPIILDANRFPPREISPGRPDGSRLAELHEFRPGIPRDDGRHSAPHLLRFSHFGTHLVVLTQEAGSTFPQPVRISTYAIPDLEHRPESHPSLPDYLRARRASPSRLNLALCRLEPEVCLTDKTHPNHEAIVAELSPSSPETPIYDLIEVDAFRAPIESWMSRDPARARERAPELCSALERISRPIQGEPYFVGNRYEGIRIVGQGEIVASDPAIPFREGDILFDGGWCANRTCSADEFGREMKRICTARAYDLVRTFVLEVGSTEPARNRSWVLMEKP